MGAAPAHGSRAQQAPTAEAGRAVLALQPGDKVKLSIWREPDLSGELEVQPDGSITFPKIGRVEVGGLTTDSLKTLIVARYSASLRDPAIEVTPLRRIVVAGSVRNAGFQYADPTVTVEGALALAGGVTPEGDRRRLELVRDGRKTSIALTSASSLAGVPVRSGDQIWAPERSWAARNAAVIASLLTGIAILVASRVR